MSKKIVNHSIVIVFYSDVVEVLDTTYQTDCTRMNSVHDTTYQVLYLNEVCSDV